MRISAVIREVNIDSSKETDHAFSRDNGRGKGQILLAFSLREAECDPGESGLFLRGWRGYEGGTMSITVVRGEGMVGGTATSTGHSEGGQQG